MGRALIVSAGAPARSVPDDLVGQVGLDVVNAVLDSLRLS